MATERVSATLNAGQSVVLTIGLTAVLAMAASGGTGVGVTAGDLVRSPSACVPSAELESLNCWKPGLCILLCAVFCILQESDCWTCSVVTLCMLAVG